MNMNNDSKSTAALYWEKVERARKLSPEERMLEGVRMFDRECEAMRLEILQANPTFSEADVLKEIRRRLNEADAENEATHYHPVPIRLKPHLDAHNSPTTL